jgi:uncharacterized protein
VSPTPLHDLRLNARELLRQPGLDRRIDVEVDAVDLGVTDPRVAGAVIVGLDAVSSVDGIVVSGEVGVAWRVPCRRCLTVVSGTARIEVDELYQDDVSDDDAFQIEGDQLDMAPAVREYVLLELPDGPLCRDDCAGICPICGIDRNHDTCTCDTSVRDERWAALDGIQLDDHSDDQLDDR